MKKIIRFILWTLLGVIVFLLVALLALPLWIGPVAMGVANAVVPGKVGTDFHLGTFALNPYSGHFAIGDMQLMNPEGCDEKIAFSLADFQVDVDVGSIASDTIIIKKFVMKDVYTSIVSATPEKDNWDVIMTNVQGEPKAEAPEETAEPKTQDAEKTADDGKSQKKVIVDDVVVDGVVVRWGKVTLPLKIPVHLTGVGRDTGGLDWAGVWTEIRKSVFKAITETGVSFKNLGLDIKDLGLDVTDFGIKGVKGLGEGLKGGSDKAVDAAKDTVDAVKDTAEKFKSLFK